MTLDTGSSRAPWISPRVAVSLAYVTSMFVTGMDAHIVNIMLPTLVEDFRAPLAIMQWTALIYTLSLVVAIPVSAWLGDRFGTKRIFIIAVLLFILGSAAAGLSQNEWHLIGFRAMQGAGGGLMTPVAMAMLYRAYPPHERARILRLLIIPILLGPVLAQPLGGFLVEALSWRWAFYMNIPVGIVMLLIAILFIVEHKENASRKIDFAGIVLSGISLAALLFALSAGSIRGWTDPIVVLAAVVGVGGISMFLVVELRHSSPLLNMAVFKDKIFRGTNLVTIFNMASFTGMLYLAPIFLQVVRGDTALTAGLITFSTAIGVLISTQTLGRLYERFGPRPLIIWGQATIALGLTAFMFMDADTNDWLVRGALFVAGIGNGVTFVAINAAMFTTLPTSLTGHGSAVFNLFRHTATAISIAGLTTVLTSMNQSLTAFHAAFGVAAAVAMIGSAIAIWAIRNGDARVSMLRQ